jgi:hypothetical protein
MKYLVALNLQSRYSRPPIGHFAYSDTHQRHVWRGKEISDIADLAQAVNEALAFVRQMDQVDLVVGVYPVSDLSDQSNPPTLSDLLPAIEEPRPVSRIKRRLLPA